MILFGTTPIPYYHRFSQTELFGFIFRTIDDKTIDNQKVRSEKTCGKFDISVIFGDPQNRSIPAVNVPGYR